MIRDVAKAPRHSTTSRASRLTFEPLEGRLLLSGTPGVSHVTYQNASYTVTLAGPGQIKLQKSGQAYTINLSATNATSSVVVTQDSITSKYNGSLLPLAGITVNSGQLGQVLAGGAADLTGTIQSSHPIQVIQLGAVGPSAKINANGGLGSLVVTGDLHLGPKGLIHVVGDLAGGLQAGSIELSGGKIAVDHNLAGLVSGSVALTDGGAIAVGNDSGGIAVTGNLLVSQGSSIAVGEDLAGLTVSQGLGLNQGGRIVVGRDITGAVTVGANATLDAGQVSVGRDILGATTITGGLILTDSGNLIVGRDLGGAFSVTGGVGLANGGLIDVLRDVDGGFNVVGNLSFSTGASMLVGGKVQGLTVTGQMIGQGTGAVDLSVGLDLNNWTVTGGVANQGSVSQFNLSVAKSIVGISIAHGLFNDFLTAGVIITGGTSTTGYVGPDGAVAVFDSQVRAGLAIDDVNFAGDVESNRPYDPSGGLTRIVAGEDRVGDFEVGGTIFGLTISGSLINAVVAASVEPYNGSGNFSLLPIPAPANGDPGRYNAPGEGAASNYGVPLKAPAFNTALDPNLQDLILPGSINVPFLESKTPTVGGAVITTAHANGSDDAGFFAYDTTGVFDGALTTFMTSTTT